jgi:ligand-binding sensor domain-containing protein
MINSRFLIFIACVFLQFNCFAQQPAYTYYSIREGLASNDVYNCVIDKKGFLWLATENGVSKFDGNSFKNYFIKDGLPDNEILNIVLDNTGVIWILPFQKSPAYYDDKKDQFISQDQEPELGKIILANVNNMTPLKKGGINFYSSSGNFYTYVNKKSTKQQFKNVNKDYFFIFNTIELSNNLYALLCGSEVLITSNNNILKSYPLEKSNKKSTVANNAFYYADSTGLSKISFSPNGNLSNSKKVLLPFQIGALNFTGKQIAITSTTGNIYFADTSTLAINQLSFSFNTFPRFVLEDNFGNTWICTKEKGLIRYQQKGIITLDNAAFQKNFTNISFFNNTIACGTNEKQILVYKDAYNQQTINLGSQKDYLGWVTEMSTYKNNLFVGAEGGLFAVKKNNEVKKFIKLENIVNFANKDFDIVSDSIIFTGNSSSVLKVNYLQNKKIAKASIRSTCLQPINENEIYIGSNTGLYKWNTQTQTQVFPIPNNILTNRVICLSYNKYDSILWVGLANDTLVALQNDKVICTIPFGLQIQGNICKALLSYKSGVVWVGTNACLTRINYEKETKNLRYTFNTFTTADGLVGKQINDIIEKNDTLYLATSGGVNILPANIYFKAPDIPVFITSVKINNVDTTILSSYNLKYNQNSIIISFAAPDLASSIERTYQYKINNGSWITTKQQSIQLFQQSAGKYIIQIKALKRDGTASEKFEVITIKIKQPLFKTVWFWFLFITLLATGLILFLQWRNKQKREQAIQNLLLSKRLTELELKALKAQINPHFVFNCLNSIKYLNHQKKFVETDLYLDKFSYLLRKTLDFSGLQKISLEEELAYSKNYLELEKLRLGEKLSYVISTQANINTTTTLVPPMLLQPYIENAIKHGIRHLPAETGKIEIETFIENDNIICRITDNGIGIEKVKKIQDSQVNNHTSHGTNLQQRRADLYNVKVEITAGDNAIGTVVKIIL